MKKIISLIMSLIILFTLCACGGGDNKIHSNNSDKENNKAGRNSFNLLYCSSDSFNPYKAQTDLNRNLASLIFEPLVKLDNNFNAKYVLANKITLNGKVCTVTINSVKFSDGSLLNAEDVVYSYNLAKSSKTKYAYQLYEVASVRAEGSSTIIFNLTRNDIYFEKLLTFPVIKKDSDKKTDIDGRVLSPIGSGKYIVNEEKETLTLNKAYHGKASKISEIKLINAPDPAAVAHYVEIGSTDIYYTDISDGSIVRMSGKKADVNLPNLVYLGMNESYGQLSSKELRYAISSAIDRTLITKNAYHNNATAATGFFHPAISDTAAVQNLQITADKEISVENLVKIGYNKLDNQGYRVNRSGNRIKLTLLVNKENESRVAAARLIIAQLKTVGIEVTLIECSYDQYKKLLESGSFQLYIGEVTTLANMDMYNLTVNGGSSAYGIKKTEDAKTEKNEGVLISATVKDTITGFYNSKKTIADVAAVLQTEMPVIPICYRKGLLFYSERVKNIGEVSNSDIYFSFGE